MNNCKHIFKVQKKKMTELEKAVKDKNNTDQAKKIKKLEDDSKKYKKEAC